MNLIIVESPTKARTLGRFLGNDYLVDSTMGHIRDLPKSKIGVDIEHNFTPEYVNVPRKEEVLARLKREVERVDRVYLATDPDREGEAIAWHVVKALRLEDRSRKQDKEDGSKKSKESNFLLQNPASKFQPLISRVTFHEITESAVKEAIEHPREIDMHLVDAQQARRVLDRLVGYKLSPLLWKKIRKGLSAGRVQSVAVRLIVEREREIEAFKAEEYWEIGALLSTKNIEYSAQEFFVRLIKIGAEKAEVKKSEQAEKIVSDLEASEYSVLSVEKKEVVKRPYAPFTTSTMTQSSARNFFWSAKKTMSVAQRLYEEGLITYHRTDSTNLSLQAINMARGYIAKEYGENYLPEKPRMYKVKSKNAQEAHEAVRPTNVSKQLSVISSQLGSDAKKLYELIWKRFLSCQMSDSVYDETRIDVLALRGNEAGIEERQTSNVTDTGFETDKRNTYTLRASGQTTKFDGWRKVYGSREEEVLQLPEVRDGDGLQLIKVDSLQKFTEPPARFNEASLVKTLEKLGIGRPSTYAPTITTIQDRQYVEKDEGKFKPTSLGFAVNDFLVENFPQEVDYDFTAGMEEDLDNIAKGEKEWVPTIKTFWVPFSKKLEGVEKNAERVKIETENTGNKCPQCKEGDEIIRLGRFGKFLSCSRFPDCKYTAPIIETINMKCPTCGDGEVVVKKTRRGKKFFGCSNYPKCKWASWRKPGVENIGSRQKDMTVQIEEGT